MLAVLIRVKGNMSEKEIFVINETPHSFEKFDPIMPMVSGLLRKHAEEYNNMAKDVFRQYLERGLDVVDVVFETRPPKANGEPPFSPAKRITHYHQPKPLLNRIRYWRARAKRRKLIIKELNI